MSPENRAQAYAKAFYEAAWERWLAALTGAARRLDQDQGLLERLEAGVDAAQRQRLLDGLLPADADAPVRNFLYTLMQHGDLASLHEIVADLRDRMQHVAQALVEVEITSAVDLTETERQALQTRLQQQFGSNLQVEYRVDPGILGGLIIRAGDKLIDGSVASRLAEMRRAMGVPGQS